jgi:outer membrane protein
MGIPVDTVIILPETAVMENGNQVKELQAWLSDAENMHPAIVAVRAEWAASREKVTVVRSEGLPRIDFAANYYKNGYPNQGLQSTSTNTSTIGVTLTIPIFDGFSYKYKVSGAQAQAEQKEQELHDTEHQILMDVVKTYADAMSSLHNLQSSETLLIAAQDSLASSKRRYEKGAADITELLNTQSTYDDAEQERVRCISEWRSARLTLLSATGVIGRTTIAE